MELKPGYKQTELGVIPEEWECIPLGKLTTLQRGYDLPHRNRVPGEYPIITSSGVGGTHSEYRAFAPGVVTGRYGTIGEVFYVEQDFWPLNTTLYVKDFHENNELFVSYLLRTIDFQSHSGKSGVPGVNRNDLHELAVARPPLPEQRAIATALSDLDALIASLDKLIAKKRDMKQAAMQELLTGKRRLPGFSGEWEVKRLGNTASLKARIGWQGLTTAEYQGSGDYYLVTGTDFKAGYIDWANCHYVSELRYKQDKNIQLKEHDVLVTKDGTIGKVALINKLDKPVL